MLRRLLALVLTLGVAAVACERSSPDCSRVRRDRIAEDAALHVVAGADVQFATDPPTSGPHSPGPAPGRLTRELRGPEQVGVLERGDVLVQFRPGDTDPSRFDALLDGDVVVAPNPSLPSAVVVTSWLHAMECSAWADIDAIATFVTEQKDRGAAHG